MNYVVAGIGFVVVWFVVAIVCSFVMEEILPPPQDNAVLVFLPGTIVGFFAGLHSWRASLRVAGKKRVQKQDKT